MLFDDTHYVISTCCSSSRGRVMFRNRHLSADMRVAINYDTHFVFAPKAVLDIN